METQSIISDDIYKYCDHYNIIVDGVFCDVKDKCELLKLVKPICHFEDHMKTICDCVDSSIPIFLPRRNLEQELF